MDQTVIEQIKKLREETGAGVIECKEAFEKAEGNYDRAVDFLTALGAKKLEKKAAREVGEGLVEAYIHSGGKIGVLVELRCETDFVARTPEFKNLAHEIALQVAACGESSVEAVLASPYVRDPEKTVDQLIKESVGKIGENIRLENVCRLCI